MKSQYPCKMIQDLMPLYYDGVCSRESAEAVEKHLSECSDCRKYYEKICADIPGFTSFKAEDNLLTEGHSVKESNSVKGSRLVKGSNSVKGSRLVKGSNSVKGSRLVKGSNSAKGSNLAEGGHLVKEGDSLKDSNFAGEGKSTKEERGIKENSGLKEDKTSKDDEREWQKAASFQAVRKQLRKRQIFVTISSIGLFCLMAGIIVITLRCTERKISYSANLTVTMTEKGLIGRLKGNVWNSAHTKRVDVEKDGQELTYLFFCLSGNVWDAVFTNKDSYMEYTVCPEDKGAEDVECVYYYTGDYSEIEMMGYEQLQEVVKEAMLLWSSEGNL